MLIDSFTKEIETSCSEIAFLCVNHMIKKIYKEQSEDSIENLKEFFSNYSNYNKYLNDYAGTIYNKYSSSVDIVYTEICKHLDISVDNKYTVEHVIVKLEKQEPSGILSLVDDDIKLQTVESFDEKLTAILSSTYYKNNSEKFKLRVEKLSKNLALMKSALQIEN